MRLLIIGGGVFVGRALAEAAEARGHELSLFNRGKSNPERVAGAELLIGDRDLDLAPLAGRSWDAVIDVCAYFPRQVARLLEALRGRHGHYTLVSSISAYADLAGPAITEDYPTARAPDPSVDAVTARTYGPLKAQCEREALRAASAPVLLVRPGIIVGPFDPTGRFAYWLGRCSVSGEVLAPVGPDAPIQLIDVRDLADWMIARVEAGAGGAFNAVGPCLPLDWGAMLRACSEAAGTRPDFVWADDAFLEANGDDERGLLPLRIPGGSKAFQGMYRVDGSRAFACGLSPRPFAQTAAQTLAWLRGPSRGSTRSPGIERAAELELIRKLRGGSPGP